MSKIEKIEWALRSLHHEKPQYFIPRPNSKFDVLRVRRPSCVYEGTHRGIPISEITTPEGMYTLGMEGWLHQYNNLLTDCVEVCRAGDVEVVWMADNLVQETGLNLRQRGRFFPRFALRNYDPLTIFLVFILHGLVISGSTYTEVTSKDMIVTHPEGIIGIKDRKVIGTNISIQPINFQAYLEGQLWPHGRTYHKGVINAMRAAKRAKDEDSLEIFRGAVWNIHHKEHLTKLFGEDK